MIDARAWLLLEARVMKRIGRRAGLTACDRRALRLDLRALYVLLESHLTCEGALHVLQPHYIGRAV